MIKVTEQELQLVKKILHKHVPDYEVRVFGSRVDGTPKSYSDLDLVIIGKEKIPLETMIDLKDAFSESDLVFRVDILDWQRISPEFRKVIERKYAVI